MRIDWEVVNGIATLVSATTAVISLAVLIIPRYRTEKKTRRARMLSDSVVTYVLVSSGWVLCVMCINWIFEPFGSHVSEGDEQKLLGISLLLPALIVLGYGLRVMLGTKKTPRS